MELTPSELEAIVNIHNPALDHLVNPDEYFDVFQGSTRKHKTKFKTTFRTTTSTQTIEKT